MQKVQRWSQPFCTCTKARARPSMPSIRCSAVSRHRHDVVDDDLLLARRDRSAARRDARACRPRPRRSASRRCRARGRPRAWRRRSAGSVCAAQPVTTMRACGRSRVSRRIAWRACRTASAVTAQVLTTTASASPARLRLAADHLRLVGVEPAAEGDDVDAHRRGARPVANSAGSKRPSNSYSTGPVISTWSSRSRHSIARSPPGSVTVTLRPVRRSARRRDRGRAGGRAAGLGQPGAALPGADDDVLARLDRAPARCWRARERSDGSRAAARSGRDRRRSTSSTQNTACGLPMLTAEGECRIGLSIGPICSSIARVSRNSSASGISSQAKARLAHVDGEPAGASPFQQLSRPALVSNVSASLPVSLNSEIGDAAHAVAAGARFRAVVVVDAHVGVGAGRARRMERHQLVVGRAGGCAAARASSALTAPLRAAHVDHHDLVAETVHLDEGVVGERAHRGPDIAALYGQHGGLGQWAARGFVNGCMHFGHGKASRRMLKGESRRGAGRGRRGVRRFPMLRPDLVRPLLTLSCLAGLAIAVAAIGARRASPRKARCRRSRSIRSARR